jgi:hypothetical protein
MVCSKKYLTILIPYMETITAVDEYIDNPGVELRDTINNLAI